MALTMAQIHCIRKLYYEEGLSVAEIIRRTGRDRKTINKYLAMEDFNQLQPPKRPNRGKSKLDPFKEEIDSWLEDDKNQRRKQRHTATRVHQRLKQKYKASYDCSYRLVADYVKQRKKEIFGQEKDFYLPLTHPAGEAQADFGEADFFENGQRVEGHFLNLSFPQSNAGYLQLFKGENQQCLMEGMINIFKHIGGVPTRIWFDNDSTMVTNVMKAGRRNLTEGFIRFMNHYSFTAAFCNPASGHEKGHVETKVGYHRRNFLVPPPELTDLRAFNQSLLKTCDEDMHRPHYRFETLISELFQADQRKLLELPSVAYDPGKTMQKKTDAHACFTLHGGKHRYSTQPRYAKSWVNVKLTAHDVLVMNESFQEITRHPRLYGRERKEAFDWLPYLTQLSRRPAALKYTGIYELFPVPVRDYLDRLDRESTREALQTMAELSQEATFADALQALLRAIEYGAQDTDSIKALFSRQRSDTLQLAPYIPPPSAPKMPHLKPDIKHYDRLYLTRDDRGLS